MSDSLKILYVDLKYDYGDPKRGLNSIGEKGFRQVFEKLGHQVEPFYYDSYLNNKKSLQPTLIAKADDFAPDLIFFCLFTDQFEFATLNQLKAKYTTACWFGDDQWRFESFTRQYAPYFTVCITTDPFALVKYQTLGIKNVILSQWAAINQEYPEVTENIDYKYDVSFVGGSHSVRRWFIKELAKKDIHVAAFGHGWPSGVVSLDQMYKIFSESKINLNLSNSVNFDLRYLTDSWKNPIVAFKAQKLASQIKARNFEIPYFGGFQLTEYVPALESYFKIGEEIACFNNVDEAAMLVQHYLADDKKREAIKKAGIQRARENHSYLNRQEEILKSIQKLK